MTLMHLEVDSSMLLQGGISLEVLNLLYNLSLTLWSGKMMPFNCPDKAF
jgi:hypothetical protein